MQKVIFCVLFTSSLILSHCLRLAVGMKDGLLTCFSEGFFHFHSPVFLVAPSSTYRTYKNAPRVNVKLFTLWECTKPLILMSVIKAIVCQSDLTHATRTPASA